MSQYIMYANQQEKIQDMQKKYLGASRKKVYPQ